jgi:hypothetical protein
MDDVPQRAVLVLESNADDNTWSVVTYLVLDSGQRQRATLYTCPTRRAAAQALEGLWTSLASKKS